MKPPIPARPSRPGSSAWILAKTAAWMVLFWAAFFFVGPALIAKLEAALGWRIEMLSGRWWRIAGVAGFVAGGMLGIWSAIVMAIDGGGTPLPFDCARTLVIRGPYRYIRNPMAVTGLAQAGAVGLYLGSWEVVLYAFVGLVVWNYFARVWEEDDMVRRFGAPYEHYRKRVRCWWPRFTPYTPDE